MPSSTVAPTPSDLHLSEYAKVAPRTGGAEARSRISRHRRSPTTDVDRGNRVGLNDAFPRTTDPQIRMADAHHRADRAQYV